MRILICDDDNFILQQLTNYLNEYSQKAGADCPEIVCYREENKNILIHDMKKHFQAIALLNEKGEREKISS